MKTFLAGFSLWIMVMGLIDDNQKVIGLAAVAFWLSILIPPASKEK